ncbi:rRNA maturation RNase YbeY [Candidatus Daviesbacteria bacterium]|nr:rRNA maturation RNase YbeY [Candidatus Daviesbacteria bacterium]
MINIIISSDSRYTINKAGIRAAVLEALSRHNIKGRIEVGINVVGDRKMHELNRKYRGIDESTDILSFALEDSSPAFLQHIPRVGFVTAPDKILRLGDIVLSYPQVVEDAGLDGISVDEEIKALVEHGVLHLLGIHHAGEN